MTKDAFLKSGT